MWDPYAELSQPDLTCHNSSGLWLHPAHSRRIFLPVLLPARFGRQRCWMSPHILAPDSNEKKECGTCFEIFLWVGKKSSGVVRGKGVFVSLGLGEVQHLLWLRSTRDRWVPSDPSQVVLGSIQPHGQVLCAAGADWHLWAVWTEELSSERPAETELSSHPAATRLK